MLCETDIQNVVDRVVTAEHPDQIIIFGSYARGDQTEDSDLDLLVVYDTISEKGRKMAEIRNAIGRLAPGVGVDVLVSTRSEVADPPLGSALYFGIREGRTVYATER